jgi:hypothetical protein
VADRVGRLMVVGELTAAGTWNEFEAGVRHWRPLSLPPGPGLM